MNDLWLNISTRSGFVSLIFRFFTFECPHLANAVKYTASGLQNANNIHSGKPSRRAALVSASCIGNKLIWTAIGTLCNSI